jgi:hypothetical protein
MSLAALLIFVLLRPAFAQDSYSEDVGHFKYDGRAPLRVKEVAVRHRNGVSIHDITYVSPKGGGVPAYLAVRAARASFRSPLGATG